MKNFQISCVSSVMFCLFLLTITSLSKAQQLSESELSDSIMDQELDQEDSVNLHVVEDICPTGQNSTSSGAGVICPTFDVKVHCSSDQQCRIGSKCCSVDPCHPRCINLKDGKITEPQLNARSTPQRRKRQSFGCVSCSCVHDCKSNNDCARFKRKKRCYKNSCSSYCTF